MKKMLILFSFLFFTFSNAQATKVVVENTSDYPVALRASLQTFSINNWFFISSGQKVFIEIDKPTTFFMYRLSFMGAANAVAKLTSAYFAVQTGGLTLGVWIVRNLPALGRFIMGGYQNTPFTLKTIDPKLFKENEQPKLLIKNYEKEASIIDSEVISLDLNDYISELFGKISDIFSSNIDLIEKYSEEFQNATELGLGSEEKIKRLEQLLEKLKEKPINDFDLEEEDWYLMPGDDNL